MKLTEKQFAFLMMAADTFFKWIFRRLENITEEELNALLVNEEKRTAELMAELES